MVQTLKEKYADYFKIGATTSLNELSKDKDLITKNFNSLTVENEMKPESLLIKPNTYDFSAADKIVDFAKAHQIPMRGHTLVWHNQTPDFLFADLEAATQRDTMIERLKHYMQNVLIHFNDNFYAWDVVNEAVDDKGSQILRPSKWLETIGEDYIEIAFHLAREIAPNMALFYNDYNESDPVKSEKIYQLVKGMLEKKVPIDGIGLQAHWNINSPSYDDIKRAIEKYASLGLKLHVTEMDVSMFNFDDHTKLDNVSKALLDRQAERYEKFFDIFRGYSAVIDAVTLWGVSDRYTWLDGFPVPNRKNWPLLFDEKGEEKASFEAIMKF